MENPDRIHPAARFIELRFYFSAAYLSRYRYLGSSSWPARQTFSFTCHRGAWTLRVPMIPNAKLQDNVVSLNATTETLSLTEEILQYNAGYTRPCLVPSALFSE